MRIVNNTNFALSGAFLALSLCLSTLSNVNAADNMQGKRSLPAAYYSDAPKSDAELTSMIKEQFALEQGADLTKINVDTVNGAVTISGIVSSQAEVDRVLQIARSAGAAQVVESTVSTEKTVSADAPMTDMPAAEASQPDVPPPAPM